MTTLNLQVSQREDDATELDNNSSFSYTVSENKMDANTASAQRWMAGNRLQNVTIPNSSTINSCTAQYKQRLTSNNDPNARIYLEDVDDSVSFMTNQDVRSRPRTTAFTVWTTTGLPVGFNTSPDFSSGLQEVVDRLGWATGNDLSLRTEGQNATPTTWRQPSYSLDSDNLKLDIDFTPLVTNVTAPRPVNGRSHSVRGFSVFGF